MKSLVIGLVVGLIIGLALGYIMGYALKPSPSPSPAQTPTPTLTPTREPTPTATPTPTAAPTPTPQPTPTQTLEPTPTPTPTPSPTPPVGYSRSNPAPIGLSLYIEFTELGTIYKARITLLEVIRGEEAWVRIREANMLNDPPSEGFEYVLAKIRFEHLESSSPDTKYDLSPVWFTAVSENGKDYDTLLFIVSPEPDIRASLYPGASHEGWTTFEVNIADSKPLMTFGRDYQGRGGVWFKLYSIPSQLQ